MLITNHAQYKKYLKEINALIQCDPELHSPEGERLYLLSLLIKEYESKHFSFKKPTAIEAILFRMQEQNLRQCDLVPFIGNKSKVSEILSGKRKLTVAMIRSLHKNLSIPLDLLIN